MNSTNIYRLQFYSDIRDRVGDTPCEHHNRTFRSVEDAEAKAIELIPSIREKHGAKAGYVVSDIETMREEAAGPSTWDDEQMAKDEPEER